ncbi:unnamed protein product [Sphagnum jensenii]|uniref:PPPDE domain-containing protein n=1 Tax=Sphagnum jensenii TaxID=128206 RepID=A0ABP1BBK2_9BRYO
MRAGNASSAGSNTNCQVPLYLNVYDLTPINGYVYWIGLGIFHSGIEAHGAEYAFGAHDYPSSGVFEVEPRRCPGFTFRSSVPLGTTDLSPLEFRSFIEQCADEYYGDTYHLIAKNCNHFTDDLCQRLTGKSIPGWVNRLARIGYACNCLLPEGLQGLNRHSTTRRHSDSGSESPFRHQITPTFRAGIAIPSAQVHPVGLRRLRTRGLSARSRPEFSIDA